MLLNCGVGEDLRVPWTARWSNQSILKEISPEYSLEGLMLKLKLQYFGHLMWKTDSFEIPWCWKRLKAEEGDDRRWGGWMVSPTQWTWVWVNSGSWWWTRRPDVLQSMGSQRVGRDWTELKIEKSKLDATCCIYFIASIILLILGCTIIFCTSSKTLSCNCRKSSIVKASYFRAVKLRKKKISELIQYCD